MGLLASPANRLRVRVTLSVVIAIWLYARFVGPPSLASIPVVCDFRVHCDFIVLPPGNAAQINIREGPGAEFKVRTQVNRGSYLTGIGRRVSTSGTPWVELAGGQGFAKESLLVFNPPRQ